MKLAVTGCHGTLGGHLVDRLRLAGHQVVGLDARPRPPWAAIDAVPDEIGEPRGVAVAAAAIRGCQAVFHLALQGFDSDLSRMLRDIAQQTANLLIAMRLAGVTRLILGSDAVVYGRAERVPIPEDEPARPENNYQTTLRVAERLAEAFSRSVGASVTIVRTAPIFGGRGRTGWIPALIEATLLGDRIPLPGGGKVRRGNVHVDDAVAALVLALDRPQSGALEVYNVSASETPTQRELCEMIAEVVGTRVQVDPDADPVPDIPDLVVDIGRARRELGYSPRPLRDGVADLVSAIAGERGMSVPREARS